MKKFLLIPLMLLVSSSAFAQYSYRVNEVRSIAWDWEGSGLSDFNVRLDGGPWMSVGTTPLWTIPTLTIGNHSAEVRACNVESVCGPEAGVAWTVLALTDPTPEPPPPTVVPNKPTNLRIIVPPPTTPITMEQATNLVQAYSYIWTLTYMNNGELNRVASLYQGGLTYQAVSEFLEYLFTQPY